MQLWGSMLSLLIESQTVSAPEIVSARGYAIEFSASAIDGERRNFVQTSTQPQRGLSANRRQYAEPVGYPYLRSGTTSFDALFALAMTEAREASVSSIRDDAFNQGQ